MRLMFSTALIAFALAGCQSSPSSETKSDPRDGSTADLAVDLSRARTEFEGIKAQRAWLDRHYPGARVQSQVLLSGPRTMDLLTIVLPSGEEKAVYFDISSYFGKL